eukprot:763008-Hanusia_phi.AAC.8
MHCHWLGAFVSIAAGKTTREVLSKQVQLANGEIRGANFQAFEATASCTCNQNLVMARKIKRSPLHMFLY